MTSYQIILIGVVITYLCLNLFIGLFISRRQARGEKSLGFVNDYYIGGRSMGGLVLAMTLIATFTSASSFIGGPGIAAAKGLAWVYLAMIQVPTAFIILAILGKKFALISRKTGAVTVTDFLRARYRSKAVVIISSLCLVLFFLAQMMSQFIGGAVLFQTITGLDYVYGLLLFGVVVILYTAIGGFKAVVTTDTIQGLVMVLGSVILLATIVYQAGGFESLTARLLVVTPNYADITAGGSIGKSWLMSFWVLVGIGVLGLPQTAVRGMGFTNTKALHAAIIYGTVVIGFLMLVMHISGVFAPAVIDMETLESTDYLIPTIVTRFMNPVVAGLFIAAPLAAVMSTVSSLLILASAAIIKDIYLNYLVSEEKRHEKKFAAKLPAASRLTTAFLGILVILFAITPPDLIVWINLFAMGGLECAFFAPIIFGLYWRRANATGAILSIIGGIGGYLLIQYSGWTLLGTHTIVPSMTIAVISFIAGSWLGKPPGKEVEELFFSK
jgi:sodium/pantothenate symporter